MLPLSMCICQRFCPRQSLPTRAVERIVAHARYLRLPLFAADLLSTSPAWWSARRKRGRRESGARQSMPGRCRHRMVLMPMMDFYWGSQCRPAAQVRGDQLELPCLHVRPRILCGRMAHKVSCPLRFSRDMETLQCYTPTASSCRADRPMTARAASIFSQGCHQEQEDRES